MSVNHLSALNAILNTSQKNSDTEKAVYHKTLKSNPSQWDQTVIKLNGTTINNAKDPDILPLSENAVKFLDNVWLRLTNSNHKNIKKNELTLHFDKIEIQTMAYASTPSKAPNLSRNKSFRHIATDNKTLNANIAENRKDSINIYYDTDRYDLIIEIDNNGNYKKPIDEILHSVIGYANKQKYVLFSHVGIVRALEKEALKHLPKVGQVKMGASCDYSVNVTMTKSLQTRINAPLAEITATLRITDSGLIALIYGSQFFPVGYIGKHKQESFEWLNLRKNGFDFASYLNSNIGFAKHLTGSRVMGSENLAKVNTLKNAVSELSRIFGDYFTLQFNHSNNTLYAKSANNLYTVALAKMLNNGEHKSVRCFPLTNGLLSLDDCQDVLKQFSVIINRHIKNHAALDNDNSFHVCNKNTLKTLGKILGILGIECPHNEMLFESMIKDTGYKEARSLIIDTNIALRDHPNDPVIKRFKDHVKKYID